MINSAYYIPPSENRPKPVMPEDLPGFGVPQEGLLWLDIEDPGEEDAALLRDLFCFHPLAVADCISKNVHQPKVDDFEDHLFMILHGINYVVESEVVETTELSLFLGKSYVVTCHDVPMRSISSVAERVRRDGRPMRKGADSLAHDILDALVDNIMPTIDEMNERNTEIQTEAISDPRRETLAAIMQLKRSIQAVERIMSPQRAVMDSLSRGGYPLIGEDVQMYYRNVYDHLLRVEMLIQTLKEMAESALNSYLSSVSNRMNEVMKVLTLVATIFIPLTFVAGIYGMNFAHMPELHWRYGYFVVLGVMLALGLAMVAYFRRKKWL